MSFIHAYAFTHPTTNKNLEVNRNGMNLSFSNLVKATFMGIRPIKHTSVENPSDYNLTYENVTFKSIDNLSLKGWMIKSPKSKGTIVMAHGYNANRGRLDIAYFLNKEGYNVLMFDFRGHGESEGDYISMGYYEKNDVLGALQYLNQRGDIDMNNVYGLGQSMGSAALIFAEQQQPSFKGLILESTYTSVYEDTATRFNKVYGFPKFPFATSLTYFGGLTLGINGFSISPQNALKDINKPVLFIHDSLDDSVSMKDAKLLYDTANQPKEFWVVTNSSHCSAYNTQPDIYKIKIITFLTETK